ncbi:MAG: Hpt domain-containing protein [Xanthobacteraceae bacterium]|nr:Hpt domain-containing protein [Xanthobacteraceae bacterium]
MAKPKPPAPQISAYPDHHVITRPNPLRHAMRYADDTHADDPVARAEQALADLSHQFGGWMTAECGRLIAAHAAVLASGFTPAARDELFRAAHDIKGDAATFGYAAAAAAAASLCRVIEHAPDLAAVPADLIAHHVQAIAAIVREQTDDVRRIAVAETLSTRLREVADDYLRAVNRDRPEHLEAIRAPSIAPRD